MLEAFLSVPSVSQLQVLLNAQDGDDITHLRNLWLLSPSMHRAFRAGHIDVKPGPSAAGRMKETQDSDGMVSQKAAVSFE